MSDEEGDMDKEVCSCGASIEGRLTPAERANWRRDHRHEMQHITNVTNVRHDAPAYEPPRRPPFMGESRSPHQVSA